MILLLYSFILVALLLFPQLCAASAREALTIWGLNVVPSLFPYMVFSKLLCEQIQHTAISPAPVCMLLGMLGGSPSGAAMIQTYRSRLSDRACMFLGTLTGVVSPMFFLGTVQSWTDNPSLCLRLMICQFSGALLAAISVFLFSVSFLSDNRLGTRPTENLKTPLSQSLDAIFQVGGCIICFSVIASLLRLLPLPKSIFPVLHALLEISGGVYAIVQFPFSAKTQEVLLAFVSGFGGLCILFQNLLFLRMIGFTISGLLRISIIRGFFSAIVMLFML